MRTDYAFALLLCAFAGACIFIVFLADKFSWGAP